MNNDWKITYIIEEKDKEINMIKAGIIGATGYAGNEIVRLLLALTLKQMQMA